MRIWEIVVEVANVEAEDDEITVERLRELLDDKSGETYVEVRKVEVKNAA